MKKLILTSILTVALFSSVVAQQKLVEDCKMTVKDNTTGKSYTITVHGTSCAALIKAMIQ